MSCTWPRRRDQLVSVEPGTGAAFAGYLHSMRFMLRVEVGPVPTWRWSGSRSPSPTDGDPSWLVPGDYRLGGEPTAAGTDRGGEANRYVPTRPAGFLGREVLRRARRCRGSWPAPSRHVGPRGPARRGGRAPAGRETDHRTLPHEVGWIGAGVHLAKGCYRGQEAVARVHNLGRPPRRLALAHIDGSEGAARAR